jgi:hypothetical protein
LATSEYSRGNRDGHVHNHTKSANEHARSQQAAIKFRANNQDRTPQICASSDDKPVKRGIDNHQLSRHPGHDHPADGAKYSSQSFL